MNVDSWGTPARSRRFVICGVVAAIHAVLLISYRSKHEPVPGSSSGRNQLILLVQPQAIQASVNSANAKKSSRSIAKEKLPVPGLPHKRAAPDGAAAADEVAANDEVPAMRNTADVDPDWAAGQTVADVRALSLSLAGKADADIRQGTPTALDPIDTPLKRLRREMAQAAKGGGNSATTAISSSGESITILTRNGKRHCYVPVSTSVAPSAVFDNRGSGRSPEIQCPKEMR